jgi:hypothetical protein
MALVMTAMGAMGTYFVNSIVAVSAQRTSQTAAQVANTAIEQIRGLRGNSLAAGRGKDRVAQQWTAAPAVMQPYLAAMDPAYDGLAAPTAGDDAPVSTVSQAVRSDATNFTRTVYVGECYLYTGLSPEISNNCRPRAKADDLTLSKFVATPRELQFYRAVVLISWAGRTCPGNTCTYIVSTLVSRQAEPTFEIHQPPPVIQTGAVDIYQSVAVNFPIVALYGQLPNTWKTLSGLPAGLSVSTKGVLTGTTGAAPGTYKPSITVTDSLGRTDTETITLNVWPKLTLTGLGDTAVYLGGTVNQTATAQGGVTPGYTFTQSGFPAWLKLAANGTITGTPPAPGAYPVTVTVTDSNKTLDTPASAQITYTYNVYPVVTLAAIADQQVGYGSPISVAASGSGGDGKLTYSASGLPLGVTINSATGVISGTALVPGRYLPLITVADGSGASASVRFALSVKTTTGLLFTSPDPAAPDQNSTVGQNVNLNLDDNSKLLGLSPTLAVTGLPPGLTLNTSSGKINGKPTAAGSYVVTLVNTNLLPPQTSVLTFVWTVS